MKILIFKTNFFFYYIYINHLYKFFIYNINKILNIFKNIYYDNFGETKKKKNKKKKN